VKVHRDAAVMLAYLGAGATRSAVGERGKVLTGPDAEGRGLAAVHCERPELDEVVQGLIEIVRGLRRKEIVILAAKRVERASVAISRAAVRSLVTLSKRRVVAG